jgi:hypothetical protein
MSSCQLHSYIYPWELGSNGIDWQIKHSVLSRGKWRNLNSWKNFKKHIQCVVIHWKNMAESSKLLADFSDHRSIYSKFSWWHQLGTWKGGELLRISLGIILPDHNPAFQSVINFRVMPCCNRPEINSEYNHKESWESIQLLVNIIIITPTNVYLASSTLCAVNAEKSESLLQWKRFNRERNDNTYLEFIQEKRYYER